MKTRAGLWSSPSRPQEEPCCPPTGTRYGNDTRGVAARLVSGLRQYQQLQRVLLSAGFFFYLRLIVAVPLSQHIALETYLRILFFRTIFSCSFVPLQSRAKATSLLATPNSDVICSLKMSKATSFEKLSNLGRFLAYCIGWPIVNPVMWTEYTNSIQSLQNWCSSCDRSRAEQTAALVVYSAMSKVTVWGLLATARRLRISAALVPPRQSGLEPH